RAEASRLKCQLLNPNVELHVDTEDISKKDEKFFADFDLAGRFIAGGVFGWIGYAFFDFTGCSFLVRKHGTLNFRTIPKVRTGGVLEDDSTEDGSSSAKKPRIDVELENGKGGKENNAVNVILDDEDEKVQMTFTYPLWDDAWNVDWSHKKLIRKSKRILPRSYFPIR
ncbi:unnamed protein product, partial [Onchocerca flexuosa]|uniref:PH domain-containing protein n=1 Tax=Onchocerca flexuosa TaxID=387005 RepID=A0A183HPD2_9BILA